MPPFWSSTFISMVLSEFRGNENNFSFVISISRFCFLGAPLIVLIVEPFNFSVTTRLSDVSISFTWYVIKKPKFLSPKSWSWPFIVGGVLFITVLVADVL